MALAKETLTVATSDLLFLGNIPSDDGKSLVFYFQGTDYISEYNYEIPAIEAIKNINFSEADLISGAFKPSHKFTIQRENLPKFPNLKNLQVGTTYSIRYAISPQSIGGNDRSISYAKMKLIKINIPSQAQAQAQSTNGSSQQVPAAVSK